MTGHAAAGAASAQPVRLSVALAALAVLWLATRPYLGVIHDAQLYAAQAIAWQDPARFADDLFFAFGSQDRFTVFSDLYGPLVGALGLARAHAAAFALGHALWLAAAWCFATALLPALRERLWALAGLILLPGTFGYAALLRYGEPFVTPRPFVEAATLAALGLALRGGTLGPVLLLLAGALLHPLMALPGIAMLVLLRVLPHPRRAALVLGAGALLVVAPLLLPGGSGGLLGRIDPEWLAVVATGTPITLPGTWSAADHVLLACRLALGGLLLLCLRGLALRVTLAALLLAVLSLLFSLVAGDVAHIRLVLAGQPWRAIWLLTCISNLLLVPALLQLRAEGFGVVPTARPTLLLLVAMLLATQLLPAAYLGLPPLLALAACHVALHRRRILPPRAAQLALVALLALAAGWALAVLLVAGQVQVAQNAAVPWMIPRAALLMAGGLALLALATRPARSRAATLGAGLGALLLPVVALASMDQRTPWQRFVETPGAEQAALAAFLPAQGRVFWDGGIELLWYRLQRPSHFSCLQGSALVFFRDTALTFRDRIESFAFQRFEGSCNGSMTPRATPPDRAELAEACRREPALDHIVLPAPAVAAPAAVWRLPVARTGPNMIGGAQPAGEVFRYDCADLR